MYIDNGGKRQKKSHKNLYPFYLVLGLVPALTACSAGFTAPGPSKVGAGGSMQVRTFSFDGEDFVENARYTDSAAGEQTQGSVRQAASGAGRSVQGVPARTRSAGKPDYRISWSNDELTQEFVAHRNAVATANSAKQQATRHASAAQKLHRNSRSATSSAEQARQRARAERERAARLREKAERATRRAKEQGVRAARLEEKAAAEEQMTARSLQESKQALQNARQIEGKASQRTNRLKRQIARDKGAHEKALAVARAARIRAQKLKKGLASREEFVIRSQQHEKALASNR